MTFQTFNYFGHTDIPNIILCNPDQSQLYSLSQFIMNDDVLTIRFNAVSEFKFRVPASIDNGETELVYYDLLQAKRLIYIDTVGYFVIQKVTEYTEGQKSPYKEVECLSAEAEMLTKKINNFTGTYKFYDATHVIDNVIDTVISYLPTWSVGYVDPLIAAKYRTFNITSDTIYSFLMTDVTNAFQCIFKFDILNKTISAYAIQNATTDTDIYLSYQNLIKKSEFKEISEEVATALSVYGGNGLNIRAVNPLGGNTIYDFSYYKNTNWMEQSLINAITAWENAISVAQPTYASDLATLKIRNQELLDLIYNPTTGLTKLQADLLVLESLQQTAVTTVPPDPAEIQTIADDIVDKQGEITAKEADITAKQAQIDALEASLASINNSLSFANNFTSGQLETLSLFIYENTYTSENIIAVDGMDAVEYQDASQELYDQGIEVLAKAANPRYQFEIDTANFISLQEFQQFSNQLVLGAEVMIDISDDYKITSVLLEVQMSFNNPNNFKLTFSNRLRLDNGNFQYSDILTKSALTSTTVSSNSLQWADWTTNYKDPVSTFITSSLNAATNNIINSTNQELTINAYGLRGRKSTGGTSYSPLEVWLTNNMLAFTTDSWQSSSIALGQFETEGGGIFSGLIADTLIGKVLAGNSLTITNDTGSEISTFTLDQNGAVLENANFSIQNTANRILLDPTNGIKIQKNLAQSITRSSSSTKTATSVTTTNFSHTVTSGNNRILVLTVASNNGYVTSATFGGQSFTFLTRVKMPTGNTPVSEIWYLLAPTVSTNTVTVNFGASSFVEIGATTFYEVSQSSPFRNYGNGYGTSSTPSINVSSASGDVVIDSLCHFSNNASVGAGQTQLYNITSDSNWKGCASVENGSTTTTMSWTIGASVDYATCIASLRFNNVPNWSDVFYADGNGNLTMTGEINTSSGTFGGWTINSSGITDSFGNYLYTDSSVYGLKVGVLETYRTVSTGQNAFSFLGDNVGDAFIVFGDETTLAGNGGFNSTHLYIKTNALDINGNPSVTGTIDVSSTPNLVFEQGILIGYS